tara:strand:- start:215 stop:481 length:267 start_codon:yes stop_codon:yes gene_type:complete
MYDIIYTMNVNFFEPFETTYFQNFSNAQLNLEDISIFKIMSKKFPNYEKDVNAWVWLKDIMPDEESKKKIQFIIDNWSDKLIEDIVNF